MATRPQSLRQILPNHSDSIRIVPLHPGIGAEAAAAPAAAPQLTYRNGPLIAAVEVFTVFYGAAWNAAPQTAMMNEINQFFDFILTSPLIDQLAEYDVPNYKITHGKRTGTTVITTPVLRHSVNDSTLSSTKLQLTTPSLNPLPTRFISSIFRRA
jgi:hypothetical protein